MDAVNFMKYFAALTFVLALIAILAMLAKRCGIAGACAGLKPPKRRLSVTESLQLDPRRRLVLVRRDGQEHLILLGIGQDVVVEHNIAMPADAGETP